MLNPQQTRAIEVALLCQADVACHIESVQPILGGDINTCYLAKSQDQIFFIKTQTRPEGPKMLQAEHSALLAIGQQTHLVVPQPLATGCDGSMAFLVMSFLDLDGRQKDWDAMGAGLAHLHRLEGSNYGWSQDNFIGTTLQVNQEYASWAQFWWGNRLQPQLSLAGEEGYGDVLLPLAPALRDAAFALLEGHAPTPSLVHGDLWCGNVGFVSDGRPAIFDPASYFGDREVDLAMTGLFGGFPESFYRAYEAAWPRPEGHQQRAVLYNLYHQLNHLNLFGASYMDGCLTSIKSLVRMASK